MGIIDDRDEQVRRLEQAMLGGAEYLSPRVAAIRAYDAGARIPDPPKPTLPVVGHEARRAYLYAAGNAYTNVKFEAGLAAAFKVILRDTVAALPRSLQDYLVPTAGGGEYLLPRERVEALIRTLTGEAP